MSYPDNVRSESMSGPILSVVGARPQFVKAFPVSRALADRGQEETLVHTGQHYDAELSDIFFEELDIEPPSYNLGVGSGSHAEQTAAVMRRFDPVLAGEDARAVVVYGDTNSTLGAAMVATKRKVPVAHVEAGLRSGNWAMPEEVNRVLTDRCSDHLFAPAESAVETLASEGITEGVHLTGDVMYDALVAVRDRVLKDDADPRWDWSSLKSDEYILATIHRPRNTDDGERLRGIIRALGETHRPVIFPAHPRTISALERINLLSRAREQLELVDPVGYLEFLRLVDGAERVVTDSGGVQKEAFYLDTPCVTLREETEWIETVETGWNVLVGADPAAIRDALTRVFDPDQEVSLYGDGAASDQIAEILADI